MGAINDPSEAVNEANPVLGLLQALVGSVNYWNGTQSVHMLYSGLLRKALPIHCAVS